jgi:hypothetical protein
MMEARHSVMMLGEEFGIRLPRSITSFIASLGPIGPALEAAFPFLALIGIAALFLEHLQKIREAGEKLTEDQEKFGTAIQTAFNTLDDKILEAEKRADELRGDHLGALQKELQLIDHASMAELVQSFGEVAKAAENLFGDLQSHWYTFGIGAEGARHALTQFQGQYDLLLKQGKDTEAHGLLTGTLAQAEKVLSLQNQLRNITFGPGRKLSDAKDETQFSSLAAQLKQAGGKVWVTDKEVEAQQTLVDALKAQVDLEQKIANLRNLDRGNATTSTRQTMAKEADEKAKQAAEDEIQRRAEVTRELQEAYKQDLATVQEGEREEIAATREGSQARLDAITAAIKEQEDWGNQESSYYRDLLTQRVALVRQMAEEEARAKAAAAREEAEHSQKMAEISLAAERDRAVLIDSARRMTIDQQIAEETRFAEEEYQIKLRALQEEEAALDAGGRDYLEKLRAIQDREKELTQAHENELTRIRDKAEEERNARVLSARTQFDDSIARGLTASIMGHETWSRMLISLGDQVVSGMIQNALRSMLAEDMTKEKDAAAAARKAFNAGMMLPFPANIIAAPVMAAGAFAAVMAFQEGGIVPGVGRGDIVPALLEPGEGVVPRGVMEGLSNIARSGGMQGSRTYHLHVRPTYHVQTIDGDGMRDALDKHSDQLREHFQGALRRMNH